MMFRWMLAWPLCIAILGNGLAWADCQTELEQAINLLNKVQNEALQDKHPNLGTFTAEFQSHVNNMQREKCLPELKKLMEHIGQEQKKYPLTPGERPLMAPIMD